MSPDLDTAPRSPEAIRCAVLDILAAQALREAEGLRAEDRLADLGIDSLGMAEVIFAIEERFDVTVPLGAGGEGAGQPAFETVADVVRAAVALVCKPEPAC